MIIEKIFKDKSHTKDHQLSYELVQISLGGSQPGPIATKEGYPGENFGISSKIPEPTQPQATGHPTVIPETIVDLSWYGLMALSAAWSSLEGAALPSIGQASGRQGLLDKPCRQGTGVGKGNEDGRPSYPGPGPTLFETLFVTNKPLHPFCIPVGT